MRKQSTRQTILTDYERLRKPKGQSKMDNQEILAQNEDKKQQTQLHTEN
jgi:hypothetical protein